MLEAAAGNRRRHDRAQVNGCVVVHAPEGAVRGRIVNLSAGGVLVVEQASRAPLAEGTRVGIELETERRGWVRQDGGVLRRVDGAVAIEFVEPSPVLIDVITGEVLAAKEAQRAPRVVVVDPSRPRRMKLAAALRAAGCHSIEASTPLEAVDALERSRVPVVAVAVAESTQSQTLADELVEFLAEAHPSLRLGLIVDGAAKAPHPRARHLRCGSPTETDDSTDLRDLVQEFLAGLP